MIKPAFIVEALETIHDRLQKNLNAIADFDCNMPSYYYEDFGYTQGLIKDLIRKIKIRALFS